MVVFVLKFNVAMVVWCINCCHGCNDRTYILIYRYRTAAIDLMLKKLTAAEEMRNKCLRDTMEDLFHSFDQQ